MSLPNLEQIRAKSALEFANGPAPKTGVNGGEAMKKIPPMIMGNGLLAAIAFSIEENKNGLVRKGFAATFDAVAKHLSDSEIGILESIENADDLIDALSKEDSETLKLATAETLEWLGYARRFVTPPERGNE